ncbi:hypothetical protein VTO73DRAFT_2107 [Trametes versicolor]
MEYSTIPYTSATSATSAEESPLWMASSTQPVDTNALNGIGNYGTWNGAGPYNDKSAGFSQNFTEAAAVLPATPIYPRCVHCMQCFDPADNGSFACAVPHSAPIHTLIAGDKALYPAIYLPCCDKGRLNMPGLHPPLNPVCRLDYHRPIIPLPFGGEIHPPQAGWTPPSPAAANSPALNGPGLVVGWQA